jgi:hypothetical protein
MFSKTTSVTSSDAKQDPYLDKLGGLQVTQTNQAEAQLEIGAAKHDEQINMSAHGDDKASATSVEDGVNKFVLFMRTELRREVLFDCDCEIEFVKLLVSSEDLVPWEEARQPYESPDIIANENGVLKFDPTMGYTGQGHKFPEADAVPIIEPGFEDMTDEGSDFDSDDEDGGPDTCCVCSLPYVDDRQQCDCCQECETSPDSEDYCGGPDMCHSHDPDTAQAFDSTLGYPGEGPPKPRRTQKQVWRQSQVDRKSSQPKACTFYAKGKCKKGDQCDYLHTGKGGLAKGAGKRRPSSSSDGSSSSSSESSSSTPSSKPSNGGSGKCPKDKKDPEPYDPYSNKPAQAVYYVPEAKVQAMWVCQYLLSDEELLELSNITKRVMANGTIHAPDGWAREVARYRNIAYFSPFDGEFTLPPPSERKGHRLLLYYHHPTQPREIRNTILHSHRTPRRHDGEETRGVEHYNLSFQTNPAGKRYYFNIRVRRSVLGDNKASPEYYISYAAPHPSIGVINKFGAGSSSAETPLLDVKVHGAKQQPTICTRGYGILNCYADVLYEVEWGRGVDFTDALNAGVEAKLMRIQDEMTERAYTSLVKRSNLCDPDIRPIVISQIAQVYRTNGMGVMDQSETAMNTAFVDGFNRAVNHRLQIAESLQSTHQDKGVPFVEVCWRNMAPRNWLYYDAKPTQLQRLMALEKLEPLAWDERPNLSRYGVILLVMLGVLLRCVVLPWLEEATKREVLGRLWAYLTCQAVDALIATYITIDPNCIINSTLTWIIPCALLALWESHKRKSAHQVLPRFLAHILLARIHTLSYAFVVHCLYNLVNELIAARYSLSFIYWPQHLVPRPEHPVSADVCYDELCAITHPPRQGDATIKVRSEPECIPKFGTRMMWGIKGWWPTVARNCSCTEDNAADERVFKRLPVHEAPPEPRAKAWRKAGDLAMSIFTVHLLAVFLPMEFTSWVSRFPKARRAALTQIKAACDGLHKVVITAKSFVKREKALKSLWDFTLKAARLIQGCPMEMTVYLGPWIGMFAKIVRRRLRPQCYADVLVGKHFVYSSGLDNRAIGDAFASAIAILQQHLAPGDYLIFIEDDQSRFDMHILEDAFHALRRVYARFLPWWVTHYLTRTCKSKGTTSHGMKYTIPFTMQSGWPDTSLGDTLVNMIMKLWIHGACRPWISIVCGDDSVTVMPYSLYAALGGKEHFIKQYTLLGMEVELKTTTEPMDVEFCSGRFYPCRGSYVLMPKTGSLLSRACFDMEERTESGHQAWLAAIASTLHSFGRVDPVLDALGRGLDAHLKGITPLESALFDYTAQYKYRISESHVKPTAEQTLEFYAHIYGIDSRQFTTLVKVLETTPLGWNAHPLLAVLVERDG